MPAPLIIAGISAAATVGGAVISANASKSASNKAAQVAMDTTTQNNALSRDIYNSNLATLNPYVTRGNTAGTAINSLLGLNPQMSGGGAARAEFPSYGEPPRGIGGNGGPPLDPIHGHGADQWVSDGGQAALGGDYTVPASAAPTPTGAPVAPARSPYEQAFDDYRGSTGYTFRLGEGMKALNTGYAAKGLLNSGAAQKAALNYGQNIASGEFGNYLTQLGQQQGVGLTAAGAAAGVGTNYANNVTANNNASASAQANAALANGQANASIWGGAANALGQLGGTLISSYSQPSKSKSGGAIWGKI